MYSVFHCLLLLFLLIKIFCVTHRVESQLWSCSEIVLYVIMINGSVNYLHCLCVNSCFCDSAQNQHLSLRGSAFIHDYIMIVIIIRMSCCFCCSLLGCSALDDCCWCLCCEPVYFDSCKTFLRYVEQTVTVNTDIVETLRTCLQCSDYTVQLLTCGLCSLWNCFLRFTSASEAALC